MKTVGELREIAHRATHYNHTHGNLSVVSFPKHTCDTTTDDVGISYRDIAQVFKFAADMMEAIEVAQAGLKKQS